MGKLRKYQDALKSYAFFAGLGCLAGAMTRLTDFFPYNSLWSLSSIATLFGFWMVTVTLVVFFSHSNLNAAVNVMIYLTCMNISFYLLKYLLGLFLPRFDNEGFQWNLLALYTGFALLCSIAGFILYFWNKKGKLGSFIYGLPIGGLASEAVGVGIYLLHNNTFLFQLLFDLAGIIVIGYVFWRKADSRVIYIVTAFGMAAAGYFGFYRLFL